VTERSGVLNLGVEGMMIIGAIAGFSAMLATGSAILGLFAAMAGGALMAALFGVLTLTMRANQVASGLALTMFGLGLSALWGQAY
ncbi:ABC transporter permease subunit, partial [Vibrio parahaemolyticus]